MRVHPAKTSVLLSALLGIMAITACDQSVTVPSKIASVPEPVSVVLTPGLSVYTDRAAWEAAVATAGGTVVNMDFAGLTTGRVTQVSTDYGTFAIVVDQVSATSFSNPGIDVFPDASCSLGTGDCDVFTFNMKDPTSSVDMPLYNRLAFPQDIIAFGGDFIQLGYTAPAPNDPTGAVTLQIGSESVVVNSYLGATGNGFFGFVATAADAVTFTFAKSGSLVNDIFNIYDPAYANAPDVDPPSDPEELIGDLRSVIAGMNYPAGIRTGFDSKLRAALIALHSNNTAGACVAMQDVANYARAIRGKKISSGDADAIIVAVTEIRSELGCS